jgi:hypothetical protein
MYAGHSRNREKLLVRPGGAALTPRPRAAATAEGAALTPRPRAAATAEPETALPARPHRVRSTAATSAVAPQPIAPQAVATDTPWTTFFRAVVETGRNQLGTMVAETGRDLR